MADALTRGPLLKRLSAGLLLVPLLAACTVPLGTYTRAGVTPEQLTRDSYECERDMRYLVSQEKSHWWIDDVASGFYDRCMKAKGYSRVD